ncbi:hypothetical protein ACQ4N7_28405 [Nodosilinea sp. AN01ver1]|uniref:hypothetical protein n=1 Tax=Nodosilinea sp. AN01ver1 TaxID=3423362 RepID=UPI003D316509
MFDIFLYAVAIVAVLWFVGEPSEATPATVPVPDVAPQSEPPRPVPAVAAAIATPVAIARVEVAVSAKPIAAMTSAELRKECQRRCIAWRNAHGKGKHLRKGEMLEALA